MIRRAGAKHQLVSAQTGRVLGTFKTKADAKAIEQAIKHTQGKRPR
jgi:hypothetical protein